MRQQWLAVGVVCVLASFTNTASAQVNTMPGQVVGTTVNFNQTNPVGRQIPKAGAPVGKPINIPGDSPLMRRYDPNDPYAAFKGTNISPNQVVAPIAGYGDQSTFDKLYDRMKSILGVAKPGELCAPNYTPGIGRRNRERAEERMWRRD